MTCSAPARELITFWLAGSLNPAEAALVSNHVEACAECHAAAVEGLAVMKGLSALHLDAEEVVAAAAGELDSPHVLVCSRCRDEVALLRGINADLARAPDRRGWIAWLPSWFVADAGKALRDEGVMARIALGWRPIGLVTLAVAAAFVVFRWVPDGRPTDDQTLLRGNAPAVVELLPVTTGTGGAPTFAWTPIAEASGYRVDVFTEGGQPVWALEVQTPPVRWPDEVPRAAGTYWWRVEALKGTAVVARSRLADLDIAR